MELLSRLDTFTDSLTHRRSVIHAIMSISRQVQNNGLQILLSPRSEGFVPLLRVSKSIEVYKIRVTRILL
jgi:hypothetical protein